MTCLDRITLSGTQRAAVLDPSPQVLVAAGAGSGKTSLLVAYFVHALLDEQVPVEELVAVTFTRKAAGELVSRIRRTLEEHGRSDLARALDGGTIGTIHSLCRRVLRRHALEAGVDPAFTVLEADAAGLLEREAAARVWAEAVEQVDDSELATLARYQRVLRAELVPLYDRLRGTGQQVPQVAITGELSLTQARGQLEAAIRSALDAGLALSRRTATLDKALGIMGDCLQWLATADADEPAADRLSESSAFFPARVAAMEPHFEPVRAALRSYRACLAQRQLKPLVQTMNGLLARFHECYEDLKRRRGALDFADLELHTRRLLTSGGALMSPVFGPQSRVMIDEFQDTNELQCSVLERLDAAALLMVGDERQSIYRFRGADVDVFSRRQAALTVADGAQDGVRAGAGKLHRLDTNYRSRREVLAFINRLFAHDDFFGGRFVALQCGREDRWASTRAADSGQPFTSARPAVELLAVDRATKEQHPALVPVIQHAEAQASAWYVAQMLENDGRRCRDIVILMPALTHAELYQQALRERGIESYVVRGKGYYSQEEVADVRCLLRILLNPHDDVALVTVLRSPFVSLSDDGLYLLGKESRRTKASSLWQTLRRGECPGLSSADRQVLDEFQRRLGGFRSRVGRPGLAGLIDDAVADFAYDLCLLVSDEGRRRFANIRKLMRLADEFEALHGPDLAGFVDVVETIGDVSDKEGSAATLAEGENVVRVMTIHQAKGLEFPVVILTGLGSDAPRGSYPSFVVDNRGRAGVFLKGSRRDTYEENDLCWGPAVEITEEERVKERQEDVRLLYVATTRAEEQLVLVGARPKNDKLSGCRIGRIAQALGLAALPEADEAVALDGLDAVARGIAFDRVRPAEPEVPIPAQEPAEAFTCGGGDLHARDGGEEPGPSRFLEPKPPGRVPRRVSFSGLSYYLECPRRFYLERVLGLELGLDAGGDPGARARELRGLDEPAGERDEVLDRAETYAGREVGLLTHALLERAVLHGPTPSVAALHTMAEQLSGGSTAYRVADPGGACGAALLAAAADSGPARALPPDQLDRAVALARAFWSSPVAGRSGLEHALKEASFCFLQGDMLISGVMDLAWQYEGCFHIVDYKTNSLEGRAAEEVGAAYHLQVAFYSLAALRMGASRVHMDLLFLEQPNRPVGFRYADDDRSALEERVERGLVSLQSGDYPARKGVTCSRCALARICAHLE